MELNNKIGAGFTADIYLSDGKIIKLLKEFMSEAAANYEADKQKLAFASGITVPNVYDVIELNGRYAIVMEYIQGDTLGSMIFKDKSKAVDYMSLSVDMQINIQEKTADTLESFIDLLKRKFQYPSVLNDKQKEELLNKASTIQHEKRLCHGDCHVLNMLYTGADIYVIDWIDASNGDVRADACRSYLLYLLHAPELADLYLQLYCGKSGLSQEEILIWKPIVAGAILSENSAIGKTDYLLEIVNSY